MHALDDLPRRPRRREQSRPCYEAMVDSLLGERWNLRQQRQAAIARDAERPQLALLDKRGDDGHAGESDWDMARHYVHGGLRRALIGDVREPGPGRRHE